jgi:hypothetical protein
MSRSLVLSRTAVVNHEADPRPLRRDRLLGVGGDLREDHGKRQVNLAPATMARLGIIGPGHLQPVCMDSIINSRFFA